MMRKVSRSIAAVLLLGVVGTLVAAPEPAMAPKSWELDFEFHDLQRIDVVLPGDTEPTTYWYLLYTVTNNSGQDVQFYPTFELVTSSLKKVTAGDDISPSVFDALEARYQKIYPFFRHPMKVTGKLLQGPDNARTSAAVFRDFDPEADSFTVYVAGLSGEIETVQNPLFDPEKPESAENPPFFTLRKTLAIKYDLPGDPGSRRMVEPVQRGKKWVMR